MAGSITHKEKWYRKRRKSWYKSIADRDASEQRGRLSDIADLMLEDLVVEQRNFATDESRRVSACCTRQCGKSYTVARRLIRRALKKKNALCIYVNATYKEAKRIMWNDQSDGIPAVLRDTRLKEEKDYTINRSELSVSFSNGSRIELIGLDRGGYEKLRGSRIDELCIDEAQKSIGLEAAFISIISYALIAKQGSICLIGTPNEFCSGFFHDVDTKQKKGWSNHAWGMWDLKGVRPDIWAAALQDKEDTGLEDDDPAWLREGLGKWVRGGLGLVFSVDKVKQLYHTGLPTKIPDTDIDYDYKWRTIIGVDIGYSPDPWAWVVMSYSMYDPNIYERDSGSQTEMTTDMQIAKIKELQEKWDPVAIIVDAGALGKQIAEDYRSRGGLPVQPAVKHDKAKAIETMDSDVKNGNFLLLEGSVLDKEMTELRWDQKKWLTGKKEFAPGCDDHCTDAAIYVHRECHHYLSDKPRKPLSDLERRIEQMDEEKIAALNPRKTTLPDWNW